MPIRTKHRTLTANADLKRRSTDQDVMLSGDSLSLGPDFLNIIKKCHELQSLGSAQSLITLLNTLVSSDSSDLSSAKENIDALFEMIALLNKKTEQNTQQKTANILYRLLLLSVIRRTLDHRYPTLSKDYTSSCILLTLKIKGDLETLLEHPLEEIQADTPILLSLPYNFFTAYEFTLDKHIFLMAERYLVADNFNLNALHEKHINTVESFKENFPDFLFRNKAADDKIIARFDEDVACSEAMIAFLLENSELNGIKEFSPSTITELQQHLVTKKSNPIEYLGKSHALIKRILTLKKEIELNIKLSGIQIELDEQSKQKEIALLQEQAEAHAELPAEYDRVVNEHKKAIDRLIERQKQCILAYQDENTFSLTDENSQEQAGKYDFLSNDQDTQAETGEDTLSLSFDEECDPEETENYNAFFLPILSNSPLHNMPEPYNSFNEENNQAQEESELSIEKKVEQLFNLVYTYCRDLHNTWTNFAFLFSQNNRDVQDDFLQEIFAQGFNLTNNPNDSKQALVLLRSIDTLFNFINENLEKRDAWLLELHRNFEKLTPYINLTSPLNTVDLLCFHSSDFKKTGNLAQLGPFQVSQLNVGLETDQDQYRQLSTDMNEAEEHLTGLIGLYNQYHEIINDELIICQYLPEKTEDQSFVDLCNLASIFGEGEENLRNLFIITERKISERSNRNNRELHLAQEDYNILIASLIINIKLRGLALERQKQHVEEIKNNQAVHLASFTKNKEVLQKTSGALKSLIESYKAIPRTMLLNSALECSALSELNNYTQLDSAEPLTSTVTDLSKESVNDIFNLFDLAWEMRRQLESVLKSTSFNLVKSSFLDHGVQFTSKKQKNTVASYYKDENYSNHIKPATLDACLDEVEKINTDIEKYTKNIETLLKITTQLNLAARLKSILNNHHSLAYENHPDKAVIEKFKSNDEPSLEEIKKVEAFVKELEQNKKVVSELPNESQGGTLRTTNGSPSFFTHPENDNGMGVRLDL